MQIDLKQLHLTNINLLIEFSTPLLMLMVHFGRDKLVGTGFPLRALFVFHFVGATVTAVVVSFLSEIYFKDLVFVLFAYGVFLFILLCEILIEGGAAKLTARRGEKWVKELDYLYLGLGAVGIMMALLRLDVVSAKPTIPDTLGPIALVTALVVRVIKTRAEIAGWNKI
jgi:hypothetical protein